MHTTETVLLVVSLFLLLCVYCPVVLYGLRKYYIRQDHFVYALRYSHITVIQAILMIIKLIYHSFCALAVIYLYEYHSTEFKIASAIHAYIAAFFFYAFVWKFWLLRYNIMLNVIVLNANWKSIINPKETDHINSNFYVKYRKTFGNQKFTMIIFSIIAIVFASLYNITILMDLYGNKDNPYKILLFSSWNYVIPFVLLIILYLTTPSYKDNFYILKELRYVFICLFINYITYCGHAILFALLHPNISKSIEEIVDVITSLILLLSQIATILISTVWVNNRCEKIIQEKRYKLSRVISGIELSEQQQVDIQPKRIEKENSENDGLKSECDPIELQNVLSNTSSYYAFINHLSNEFCVECLLSLTEFVQYSQYIVNTSKEKIRGLDTDDNTFRTIQFSSNIPISYIVQNDEWNRKEKAYQLYTKYIKIGSDFEINLSAKQRQNFTEMMDNPVLFYQNDAIGDHELAFLFETPAQEMMYLMTDALTRFEKTPQYDKLPLNLAKNN